ncbi:MAG: hypothetical protein F6K62_16450 [Sphaerospermopsis sp. SIO1G2]|nr:hypothetical protein [Sphaerospermopsis sp. SIO1G2]
MTDRTQKLKNLEKLRDYVKKNKAIEINTAVSLIGCTRSTAGQYLAILGQCCKLKLAMVGEIHEFNRKVYHWTEDSVNGNLQSFCKFESSSVKVLRSIAFGNGRCSVATLSRDLVMPKTTIQANIKKLLKQGTIECISEKRPAKYVWLGDVPEKLPKARKKVIAAIVETPKTLSAISAEIDITYYTVRRQMAYLKDYPQLYSSTPTAENYYMLKETT